MTQPAAGESPASRSARRRKIAVSAFIIAHWFLVLVWVSPAGGTLARFPLPFVYEKQNTDGTTYLKPLRLYDIARSYLFNSAQWQDWSMFAPNPLRTNRYQEYAVVYADGSSEKLAFPRVSELGPLESRLAVRLRKYQTRFPRLARPYREDLARYCARRMNTKPGNPPQMVIITNRYMRIPPHNRAELQQPGYEPDYTKLLRTEPSYRSEVALAYRVKPEDLE